MNKITGPVQKIWGETTQFFLNATSEGQFMRIKKGWFCSEHIHERKWNRFFLIDGKLKVTIFEKSGPVHHILEPGQSIDIEPGCFHKFEALENCLCVEMYWTDILEPGDIVRRTTGGGYDKNSDTDQTK